MEKVLPPELWGSTKGFPSGKGRDQGLHETTPSSLGLSPSLISPDSRAACSWSRGSPVHARGTTSSCSPGRPWQDQNITHKGSQRGPCCSETWLAPGKPEQSQHRLAAASSTGQSPDGTAGTSSDSNQASHLPPKQAYYGLAILPKPRCCFNDLPFRH